MKLFLIWFVQLLFYIFYSVFHMTHDQRPQIMKGYNDAKTKYFAGKYLRKVIITMF